MPGLCDRCMTREAWSASDLYCDQCEAEIREEITCTCGLRVNVAALGAQIDDLTRQHDELNEHVEARENTIELLERRLGEMIGLKREAECQRDEAVQRADLLKNGWDQFIGALEGEIPGIEWKTKAEIDDASTRTNFGSMAEQIYAYAIEDGRNYDREFADTAEKERDEQRQRAETAEAQLSEAQAENERLKAKLDAAIAQDYCSMCGRILAGDPE